MLTIINLFIAFIILFVSYILFTFICSLFVNMDKTYNKNNKFYRFLLNSWTSIGLKLCRIKIDLVGLENIHKNTRFVVVGNHRSNFDPIITWHILKKYDISFISKKANFKIPIFGRIIKKCCFMDIDRENPRNAYKTIEHAVNLINDDVASIGVYPEGTRSKNGELLPFHNCVFKIAQKSKTPLVIITLDGSEKIAKNTPFHKTIIKAYINTIEYEKIEDLPTCEIGDMVIKILNYNLGEEKKENENNLCTL